MSIDNHCKSQFLEINVDKNNLSNNLENEKTKFSTIPFYIKITLTIRATIFLTKLLVN